MKKLLLASLCFLMLCAAQVYAQTKVVTGTVTSKDDGFPLPGVSVKVPGTKTGTQTNAQGKFSIEVPSSAKSLQFSFIGSATEVVAITGSVVNIALSPDSKQLSEVVVTAGGLTVTKGSQGYATKEIKPAELTAGKATNVGAALSGKVAGLQVNAVSSGVNPTVRIVLRGNRSLLGNNQALIVIDNVIVPSSILGNVNPEDVDDIQVLNGAGAAALYGSDASNGAIIITTKKGKKGEPAIRVAQTTSFEHVSFYPKLQTGFGSGSANDVQEYIAFENQQYGPAFDGASRIIGKPISTGAIQSVPYAFNNSKESFWETGVTNQSDFSLSSGDDRSTFFVSGQYVDVKGTTPGDKYNRAAIRANGNRNLGNKVSIGFTTNYVQNRYDITTATATLYDQLEQTPGNIVVTDYKDWQNNPYADPNGYYNEYYANPYYTAANNRQTVRNDYFIGTAELKYNPFSFLNFTYRVGVTNQNQTYKTSTNKFILSLYTVSIGTSTIKRNNIPGSVEDGDSYSTRLTNDFYGTFNKTFSDFRVTATLGGSLRGDQAQAQTINATGLVQRDLFNVAQRYTANSAGGETGSLTRQQAVYGDLKIGYKSYLSLHVTGRNDWLSVLAPQNRSFFYPAADVSFVPTEAFDILKNSKVLTSLKLRAGVSKVGQAAIGAYSLLSTFSQSSGYPFSTGPGYGLDDRIVSTDLKPEITKGYEAGLDADFYSGRMTASFTYYKTQTNNQTVPIGVSNATGYTSYLTNTGEVDNTGVELALNFIPLKTASGFQLSVGGNFTFNDNKVVSISNDLKQLALSTGSTAQTYAIEGMQFPVLLGSDYFRDPQGRIIVDKNTGYPTVNTALTYLGNTSPKQRLGLNFEVKYKTVRLSALAEYRGGFQIFNSGAATSFDFSGSGVRSAYYNRERFVIPNSSYLDPATNTYVANTNVSVADGGAGFFTDGSRNTNVASNYVVDGSSWKLREAALSYDLPKSMLSRIKTIKGATISLQGRNLFLWTPKSNIYTDPEYNFSDGNAIGINSLGQTPPTRYYGASVSITL